MGAWVAGGTSQAEQTPPPRNSAVVEVINLARPVGGRLGRSSRLWRALPGGLQLGDALGHGHDDGVLTAGFFFPVFELPLERTYLIPHGLDQPGLRGRLGARPIGIPSRLGVVQSHVDRPIRGLFFGQGPPFYTCPHGLRAYAERVGGLEERNPNIYSAPQDVGSPWNDPVNQNPGFW